MKSEMQKPSRSRPTKTTRVNDDAVEAVADSIHEFGFRQPIVVDNDDVIIVGHTRHKAAREARAWPRSPSTSRPSLVAGPGPSAYRIADNQTATMSGWDDDKLPLELAALQEMNFT